MPTVVTNVSNPNHPKYHVYIGRVKGSAEHYGNPFPIEPACDRESSILRCDQWLQGTAYQNVEPERRLWIWANLPFLKDRVIGCHCKPEACHGDIYVRMLDAEAVWDFHKDPYKCFSNFSEHTVLFNDVLYKTSEHAYQAWKALNQSDHDRIAAAATAGMAKRLGRGVTLKPYFMEKRIDAMAQLVYLKFTQHDDIRQILLDSGNCLIVEGNWWGDTFWGMCKDKQTGAWKGQNVLGRILMAVRGIFQNTIKINSQMA